MNDNVLQVPSIVDFLAACQPLTPEQQMAKTYGQRLRDELGEENAHQLANAMYRDGRNDTLFMQAKVAQIKGNFPEYCGYVAGALDPEYRNEDGSLRHPQS